MTEKLIITEEYWRAMSYIQTEQIRIHEKNAALYSERINLMLENETAYKNRVQDLQNEVSQLQGDNTTLHDKVKKRNHVIIGTAVFAILEGMLIFLLTK